ncbi:MAG: Swt1 family HEPN domain-containing protein [Chloroflexota bacterium]|nr:Swt1 family HEPN domain-containing protein [Chloroflexota bacterium]
MNRVLVPALLRWLLPRLQGEYGKSWWQKGVARHLNGNVGKEAKEHVGPEAERFNLLDAEALFTVMNKQAVQLFGAEKVFVPRSLITLAWDVRTRMSHVNAGHSPWTVEEAYWAVDVMYRLLERINVPEASEAQELANQLLDMRTHLRSLPATAPEGAAGHSPTPAQAPYPNQATPNVPTHQAPQPAKLDSPSTPNTPQAQPVTTTPTNSEQAAEPLPLGLHSIVKGMGFVTGAYLDTAVSTGTSYKPLAQPVTRASFTGVGIHMQDRLQAAFEILKSQREDHTQPYVGMTAFELYGALRNRRKLPEDADVSMLADLEELMQQHSGIFTYSRQSKRYSVHPELVTPVQGK